MPTNPSSNTTPTSSSGDYDEIVTIPDPDGPIVVITERKSDGRMSFSLQREFESGGKTRRSIHFNSRHIPGIVRLLNDIGERIEQEEDRARARRRTT